MGTKNLNSHGSAWPAHSGQLISARARARSASREKARAPRTPRDRSLGSAGDFMGELQGGLWYGDASVSPPCPHFFAGNTAAVSRCGKPGRIFGCNDNAKKMAACEPAWGRCPAFRLWRGAAITP